MTTTAESFTLAQQAANEAYAMTLEQTGDVTQASDDYKAVMSAYYAAQDNPLLKCQRLAALVPDGPRPGWISKTDCMVSQPDDIDAEWIALVWPTLPEIAY